MAAATSPADAHDSTHRVVHPGNYVKERFIAPKKITVTEAAKIIGLSRPATSNFLNGKASASADMAARIERAFKIPAKKLLDMQAAYDAAHAKAKGAASDTRAYVPPFLAIKASNIEAWVSHNIGARSRLSVFLRTLVHSTGVDLVKVDFPGNDDSERAGWDGFVEASEGTPWVPKGLSGWEFGTNENIKAKANKDFAKSVSSIPRAERDKMTFVFVTPRRWSGKDQWVAEVNSKGAWREVRAYDANTLEQWLEQSLAGQAWFANETLLPTQDVRSLDRCWSDWADAATPPLTGALFASAIEAAKRTMLTRLSQAPHRPTIIAADSTEEALAFLAQLLGEQGGDELAAFRDRVLVFDKPGVLTRLARSAQTFVAVAATREVEREVAPFVGAIHTIVVYPRNAANTAPDIVLEPVDDETFRKALEEMNKNRDEVLRLAKASGRSLTVLRRQLSVIPAVKTPEWAAHHKTAQSLIPFLFVGCWNSRNETDKLALSLLANDIPYADLEKECQRLSQLNDAPIWSIGSHRGVVSKIDLLYAIAPTITEDDLKRYFSIARLVLGEDDPTLDFPDDRRWAASIYGKRREFSSAFREGISETLVLLAVHGSNLFRARTGMDCELEAGYVVRDLLPAPLTNRILEANDDDLPTYAEAAPDVFLSIIERDLNSNAAVLSLLRPAAPGILGGSPSRTGLLWALEGLSWNPTTLPRAARILARLAQVEISDNWANKPVHSLESIFRSWMPQTAASHEIRLEVIKELASRFSRVAWQICVAQFGPGQGVGDYSHKPRWRSDAFGFGEPFSTWGPILTFQCEMVEMALNWKQHSLQTLSDLVARLDVLNRPDQARVWNLVKSWASEQATDNDKAEMRETIRISALSVRAARRAKKDSVALSDAARAAYAALEPTDLMNRHAWLFRESWVEESYDEIHREEEPVLEMRDQRIQSLRIEALREIFHQRGLDGLIELAGRGNAAWQIGFLAGSSLLSEDRLVMLVRTALAPILAGEESVFPQKSLICGALRGFGEDKRIALLNVIAEGLSDANKAQLFLLAPFGRRTWSEVDTLGADAQTAYWHEVAPDCHPESHDENNEAVVRLLKAERPRAAFACIRFHPEKLDGRVLFRLLTEMAKGGKDKPSHFQLEQYRIEKAFKQIDASVELTLEQKAGLEFAYIDVLARPWSSRETHGIPNLERYVELHPEFLVQAIVWVYKRADDGIDPTSLRVAPENRKRMAERGYKLLESLERVPGHNNLGELEAERLAKWINTVRQSCAELSRGDPADASIGKLLSCAPIGRDGVWPCEAVRQVMEDIRSENIMRGARMGRYNARGVHMRAAGGSQERELVEQYRKWAMALQFSHPYVSQELLMGMVKTYEHEADHEDTEAEIRRRLL